MAQKEIKKRLSEYPTLTIDIDLIKKIDNFKKEKYCSIEMKNNLFIHVWSGDEVKITITKDPF